MYVTNNKYELGFICSGSKDVSIQTLLDSGDLKLSTDKLTNPKNDSEIPLDTSVKVTYDCNTKEFTYEFSLNC